MESYSAVWRRYQIAQDHKCVAKFSVNVGYCRGTVRKYCGIKTGLEGGKVISPERCLQLPPVTSRPQRMQSPSCRQRWSARLRTLFLLFKGFFLSKCLGQAPILLSPCNSTVPCQTAAKIAEGMFTLLSGKRFLPFYAIDL